MEITKIQQQKKRKTRYNIFVDNNYLFSITEADLIREKVAKGPISDENLTELRNIAIIGILYEYSLTYEARRPHSLLEHKRYLHKKAKLLKTDVSKSIIEKTLEKLQESGYQDDKSFATWLVNQRLHSSKPKGKISITTELIKKGISQDIIKEVIEDVIDKDIEIKNAQLLANKKLEILKKGKNKLTEVELKTKIARFLISRGYTYDVIKCIQLI